MIASINNPIQLGQSIRAARKAQGFRQDELAGAAGVGVRFVIELEAGKPTIQLGKALQILNALGLSLSITDAGAP
jgi:y4mF family transcriptional regulator